MNTENTPVVEAQMLIRKPVSQVFEAFLDPDITTQFWFTKSTGPLEVGKTVTWTWEMYGVHINALPREIITDKLISLDWGAPATRVDFHFKAYAEDSTYLVIRNYGFHESGEQLMAALVDNTGGFTTVLDGLKAYLEHGIHLNLIADKFPHGEGTKDHNQKGSL